MPFPQSFMDELTARNDIVDVVGSYVQLTRKGGNLFGLCPFHNEKTGSFSVSAGQADLLLLRLQEGRRRHQLHHGGWRTSPFRTRCAFWPSGRAWRCRRRKATGRPAAAASALLDLNRDAARFYYQLLQQSGGSGGAGRISSKRQIRPATAVQLRHGRLAGQPGTCSSPP